MRNKIDFKNLKREEIYKSYDGVDVFNPNDEQKIKIIELFQESIKDEDDGVEINDQDVMLKLIPMLTNIEIDFEDNDLIQEVINDPSDMLLDIIQDINDIVEGVITRTVKTLNKIAELPEEEQAKLLEKVEPKEIEQVTIDKDELERLRKLASGK
jgi:hypothetical protein